MQLWRDAGRDLRHTLRLWARRPWHTGFAIAALSIGIGATTGVFSVVNALLLRSLPFRDPGRLVLFQDFVAPNDSAKQFQEWWSNSGYLEEAAASEENDVNLGGVHDPGRVHAAQTSSNFFSMLGAQPALGRAFLHDEDRPGHAVAVIGYGLWQQLFAGDRRVLGSTIRMDGTPLTVIGVAPPGFDYPHGTVVWKAGGFHPGNNGWDTVGRLKSGVTEAAARQAFNAEAERLWPAELKRDGKVPSRMLSLRDGLAGPVKNASLMLLAGVVLVLLIACTNVANLLMARTADRASELFTRSALGASRARLARQMLTECLLLSSVAAMVGLAIAYSTTSIATRVQPPSLSVQSYSVLDGRVLAFAVAVSVLSGILFGVLPSLYASRIFAFRSRGNTASRGLRMLREMLAGAQVMLTIVLLTASVSVGRAFVHLMSIDRGYQVRNVATVSVSLDGTTHQEGKRQLAYFEEALARVRRLPGVRSASATEFLPLYATGGVGGTFGLDGHDGQRVSSMIPIFADYFATMGGTILYGREFTDAEVQSKARVAVVNERFTAQFGAPAQVVGRQLTIGREAWRIVGVVQGMDADATGGHSSQVFVPSTSPGSFFSTFVARMGGRAENHLGQIRDAIRSVDPQVPVFGVKTMQARLDDAVARPRLYRTAVWMFGGFALLLAVIGIYGIVSYAVAQRTQEMGVRMALGTTPVRLRGVLLRQGLVIVAAGAIPGAIGARLSGRWLENLIAGAKSIDLATSTCLILFIGLVASTSIWAATRRLANLDIAAILRME